MTKITIVEQKLVYFHPGYQLTTSFVFKARHVHVNHLPVQTTAAASQAWHLQQRNSAIVVLQ